MQLRELQEKAIRWKEQSRRSCKLFKECQRLRSRSGISTWSVWTTRIVLISCEVQDFSTVSAEPLSEGPAMLQTWVAGLKDMPRKSCEDGNKQCRTSRTRSYTTMPDSPSFRWSWKEFRNVRPATVCKESWEKALWWKASSRRSSWPSRKCQNRNRPAYTLCYIMHPWMYVIRFSQSLALSNNFHLTSTISIPFTTIYHSPFTTSYERNRFSQFLVFKNNFLTIYIMNILFININLYTVRLRIAH